jgi:hypothetical protein
MRKLASRQSGNFTRAQLLRLGLGAEAIKARLRNGTFVTRYHGVYCQAPARQDPQALIHAAVLAGGPQAVASHASAAWLWAETAHAAGQRPAPRRPPAPGRARRHHRPQPPPPRHHAAQTVRAGPRQPHRLTLRRRLPDLRKQLRLAHATDQRLAPRTQGRDDQDAFRDDRERSSGSVAAWRRSAASAQPSPSPRSARASTA